MRGQSAVSTTIALTKEQHAATKKVYREWLYEKTGRKVGGKIEWNNVLSEEIQALSERMLMQQECQIMQE